VSSRTAKGSQHVPIWRPLREEDLQEIDRIADTVHTELPERPEVFMEKFHLYPQGCFALTQSNKVVGYGISHLWKLNDIPPLDAFLKTLPVPAACLYLHDVAIMPSARGHNCAAGLIELLKTVAIAEGIGTMALVSVYGTDVLWGNLGFRETLDPRLSEKLRTYGPTARYMIKQLSS
jgi:ribosomal protein S18 acetylase RimI-like enzyme